MPELRAQRIGLRVCLRQIAMLEPDNKLAATWRAEFDSPTDGRD